jgi:iron complex outermembrane receptor protein
MATGLYQFTPPRPLTNNDYIVFTYIGFQTTEVRYNGNNDINAKLIDDTKTLNDVVVTALGIKREEKILRFRGTNIKSKRG